MSGRFWIEAAGTGGGKNFYGTLSGYCGVTREGEDD